MHIFYKIHKFILCSSYVSIYNYFYKEIVSKEKVFLLKSQN